MEQTLDRYKLIRPLATGGVAEVYLARLDGPGGFSRPVVLKRLKPAYRFEPTYRRALLAEARIGALLDHPNIMQYLELIEQNDELFVVTEYMHGCTVRALIQEVDHRRNWLPIPVALSVAVQVLEGLHFAHNATDDRGAPMHIVHRDVSPENVFICTSGAVKLMDFGIALGSMAPRDTEVNFIKGKARYFSPEQAMGETVNRTSDIYSVGLLLFELFTNTPALSGEDDFQIVEKARKGLLVSSRSLRPELPERVNLILDTALAPEPQNRYDTALEMSRELRTLLSSLAPSFCGADLQRCVEESFGQNLETQRRQIWRDQATQVADVSVVLSADLGVVPGPVSPRRAAPKRTETPRYRPEAPAKKPSEEAPAPEIATKPANVAPAAEAKEDGKDKAASTRQVDLAGLRRAITEAYDD